MGTLYSSIEWMKPPTPHIASLPFFSSFNFDDSSMGRLSGLKPSSPGTAPSACMSVNQSLPLCKYNSQAPMKKKICAQPASDKLKIASVATGSENCGPNGSWYNSWTKIPTIPSIAFGVRLVKGVWVGEVCSENLPHDHAWFRPPVAIWCPWYPKNRMGLEKLLVECWGHSHGNTDVPNPQYPVMLGSRFFGFFMNGIAGLASGTAMRVTERGDVTLTFGELKRTPRVVGVAKANILKRSCMLVEGFGSHWC